MIQTAGSLPLIAAGPAWLRPLWVVGLGTLAAVVGLLLILLLLRLAVPKVAAIARTTWKESMSQPIFYVLLGIGALAIIIFPVLPYHTFGEDVKMVKSTGLTAIKLLAIFLGLWTASMSIAEEIEGRTALTLLSKPIGRRQLILGKFLGIVVPVAVMFIVLGTLFLASVSYKVVYDAYEMSSPEPTAAECSAEMLQILPGLVLAFLEAVILVSVSVAISTRLPMIPNLVICLSIYVLGHLVPVLVNSAMLDSEIIKFFGQFLATLLPVLGHFGMEGAISMEQTVPWSYVAWVAIYCLVYSAVAMLLALLLFEDRDLA